MPEVVVFPKDEADVETLVSFTKEQKKLDTKVSITPRSAGTCMSGGPLNESIILDTTKYLNNIISVDEEKAIVQPGVYYRDFEKQTLAHGSIMPAYTASKDLCAVGGMVGNNSGGEKTIKYGKVERYVKRQRIVFSDGRTYEVKPLNKTELLAKIAREDFEGRIYKQVFDLVEQNYDLLQQGITFGMFGIEKKEFLTSTNLSLVLRELSVSLQR